MNGNNTTPTTDTSENQEEDEILDSKKKHLGSIWDQKDALETLINIVGSDEYIFKLTSPHFKKKPLWEEIAEKIEEAGIAVGVDRCRVAYQKWLNLKKNYVTILNKKGGKIPTWFNSLHEVITRSQGKLLGNLSYNIEEEEDQREPVMKKFKKEPEEETENMENTSQYIISDNTHISYSDVIAVMQQLEDERKEREDARERRENERFERLTNVLKQQNELIEKLISVLHKENTEQQNDTQDQVISLDPSICIIKTSDMSE